MVQAIACDTKKMFPCSCLLEGEYGLSDISIGVPAIIGRNGIEKIVEIELDGAQTSSRYPGGVALRFARVLRYRPDKTPAEADTIDTVRDMRL